MGVGVRLCEESHRFVGGVETTRSGPLQESEASVERLGSESNGRRWTAPGSKAGRGKVGIEVGSEWDQGMSAVAARGFYLSTEPVFDF